VYNYKKSYKKQIFTNKKENNMSDKLLTPKEYITQELTYILLSDATKAQKELRRQKFKEWVKQLPPSQKESAMTFMKKFKRGEQNEIYN